MFKLKAKELLIVNAKKYFKNQVKSLNCTEV